MTRPTVTIREALPHDLERIHRVERASFSDPWSVEMFCDLIARSVDGSVYVVVATKEGDVAGFAVAERADREAHLANIAVDPTCRRAGIARALMEAVLEWAHRQGLEEVWLEVRESNIAALNLYRELGFAEVTRRVRYYRYPTEDALVMALPLRRIKRLHDDGQARSFGLDS